MDFEFISNLLDEGGIEPLSVKAKKILVRAPNWIGDAVISLPAVSSLKRLFPEAEISVLTRKRAIPVFENNPDIKETIVYDEVLHKGIRGRLKLAGELSARGFDTAVLFQNAFDAALIAFLARIPERIGYARDLRTFLLTKPVKVADEIKRKHQVFYYLNIVNEMGKLLSADPIPAIHISEDEKLWADAFLREKGILGKMLAGASPGASYGRAKRWMPERFAETLNIIAKRHGAVPLIFGGPEDKPVCNEVAGKVEGQYFDLSGKITLRQFIAIASRVNIFITNDSGPMHITAALGTPTVAVFGSTDTTLTGPLGRNVKVVTKNIDCSPCFRRECRYGHYKCLEAITPAEVLEKAEILLNRRAV